jgi:hypothetical protein
MKRIVLLEDLLIEEVMPILVRSVRPAEHSKRLTTQVSFDLFFKD